jgi:hypothetical protein
MEQGVSRLDLLVAKAAWNGKGFSLEKIDTLPIPESCKELLKYSKPITQSNVISVWQEAIVKKDKKREKDCINFIFKNFKAKPFSHLSGKPKISEDDESEFGLKGMYDLDLSFLIEQLKDCNPQFKKIVHEDVIKPIVNDARERSGQIAFQEAVTIICGVFYFALSLSIPIVICYPVH